MTSSPTRTPDEIERWRFLASARGLDLVHEAGGQLASGASTFRIGERLREHVAPEIAALVLLQVELRARARAKWPQADDMLFTREGYEQGTSWPIAHYRAGAFENFRSIADLCCGIGGDLMALADSAPSASITGVDLDPVHLIAADHNARLIAPSARLTPVAADVTAIDPTQFDAIFIDPARRTPTKRMIGDASIPPIPWALGLANQVAHVAIKAAPGFLRDLVPDGWSLETISLGRDLKEVVLWSPAFERPARRATILRGDEEMHLNPMPGPPVAMATPEPGMWLLDPYPAVTRAGLVEDLARTTGAERIDPDIAFLVSSEAIDAPFGRSLPILASLPWDEKALRRTVRSLDAGPVTVRRRGLAGDPDRVAARLRGNGHRLLVVAMTRVNDQPWAIVCADLPGDKLSPAGAKGDSTTAV